MARIRLVHWKPDGARPYVEVLKKSKFTLEYSETVGPEIMRAIKLSPPDAIVIDLSALPSHGRELGMALRAAKSTRTIPLVFCEGIKEKVEAIKLKLPDAEYTTRSKLAAALGRVLKRPPQDPIAVTAMMDRYQDRTAAQKLGIEAGSKVAVMALPRQSPAVLSRLPAGVEILEDDLSGESKVALYFATDARTLASALESIRAYEGKARTWVLWRKQPDAGEITQQFIREQAALLGLVDYKLCSADEVWSAMLLTKRRER